LIFVGSSDAASGARSSRILGPLLLWLFPCLSCEHLVLAITFFRKCAHVTEYSVLALLVWRALHRPRRGQGRPWLWSQARTTLLVSCLYAASDEFHQRFVPCRQASVADVVIDTLGAALALLAVWLWRRKGTRLKNAPR
ncbi:MAG: VanZ family protein, partial [Verrucomicrobia bacterium]|nr:VanZ family protein [Verrucomicrobiota bacterium]